MPAVTGVASEVATPAKQRRQLFSTFGYLIATPGATAVLGLAYWAIATRTFSARDVGIAAAAVSTATFLALIGSLGTGTLLLAEIGSMDPRIRRSALTTGTAVASSCVALLALGTIALSPFLGSSLRAIGSDPITAVLFVAGAIATVAVTTFDNAAIGAHRGPAQLARGILASVLKIACVGVLIFVGRKSSAGLILAWGGGLAASLADLPFPLALRADACRADRSLSARVGLTRRYGMLSLNHHVLNLSINSVSFVLPVVAALLILPQEVAYFSTAQVVAQVVLMVPYLLTLTLFVETSNNEQLLHQHLRRTLPLGFAACLAIVIGVELAAPIALRLFGAGYSRTRDHRVEAPRASWPVVRREGPLRRDPPRPGSPHPWRQGRGALHHRRDARGRCRGRVLGPFGALRRLGDRSRVRGPRAPPGRSQGLPARAGGGAGQLGSRLSEASSPTTASAALRLGPAPAGRDRRCAPRPRRR